MSHQIALAFEDGVTRFIRCEEDQTVADASYRARINIPLDCRDGACGTCKAFCESGEYDGGTYIDDALTAGEAEQGFVLPCSMKPRSDLVLQIASTSAVAKTSAASYTATVSGLKRLSLTTYALELIIANRSALAFLPGQYVNLHVPGTDQIRSYSFSNSPASAGLSFLMKLTPGGAMSGYLAERAAVGDTIEFTGPNGSFFLREGSLPVLLLAGGTGLAPVLSILRQLRDEGSQRPVHLVYGVSTDDDLIEMDTLQELADDLGLTWSHCVVDPASRAEHIGYVTGLIGEEQHRHGAVAVYLCGPPRMVEAVRTYFTEQGIEPAGFYFEKFALSASVNGALAAVAPAVAAAPPAVEAVAPVIPVIVIPAPIVAVPPVPVPLAPVDVPVRAATAASGSDHGLNRSATVSARSIAGQLVFQPLPPPVLPPAFPQTRRVPSAVSLDN